MRLTTFSFFYFTAAFTHSFYLLERERQTRYPTIRLRSLRALKTFYCTSVALQHFYRGKNWIAYKN